MHIDDFYPSQYLKARDFKGKDVTLTFSRITRDEVVSKEGKKQKAIAFFKELREHSEATGEEEKRFIMPITVLRQVAKALSEPESQNWIGKRVTLFPTTCSGKAGETVDCIRAREVAPKETK